MHRFVTLVVYRINQKVATPSRTIIVVDIAKVCSDYFRLKLKTDVVVIFHPGCWRLVLCLQDREREQQQAVPGAQPKTQQLNFRQRPS
jgi:hypothetical protein